MHGNIIINYLSGKPKSLNSIECKALNFLLEFDTHKFVSTFIINSKNVAMQSSNFLYFLNVLT